MLKQQKVIGTLSVSILILFFMTIKIKASEPKPLTNKIIPLQILESANIALSHYPTLKDTPIEFKIKKGLKTSFMKAQPKIKSILNPAKKRKYQILISDTFSLENKSLKLNQIPKNVMIGWLGHELGHIMDYKERSSWDLIIFGLGYSFSENRIREAERIADSYAVSHHMKDYILATKNFILNHTDLSDKYKARIKRLYVSPEEILKIAQEQGL